MHIASHIRSTFPLSPRQLRYLPSKEDHADVYQPSSLGWVARRLDQIHDLVINGEDGPHRLAREFLEACNIYSYSHGELFTWESDPAEVDRMVAERLPSAHAAFSDEALARTLAGELIFLLLPGYYGQYANPKATSPREFWAKSRGLNPEKTKGLAGPPFGLPVTTDVGDGLSGLELFERTFPRTDFSGAAHPLRWRVEPGKNLRHAVVDSATDWVDLARTYPQPCRLDPRLTVINWREVAGDFDAFTLTHKGLLSTCCLRFSVPGGIIGGCHFMCPRTNVFTADWTAEPL